jgi:outer membrane protein assembly factor BamB
MITTLIGLAVIFGLYFNTPENNQGPKLLDVHKEWVVSTLAQDDITFRKTHRMKSLLLEDRLIQGNAVDGISAFGREKGNLLWRIPIVGGVEGGADYVNDRIFFGGNNGLFYSASLKNGEVYWTFPAKTEVLSAPSLWEGNVYFLAGNNILYALDAAEGRELWIYSRVDSQNISVRGASRPVINKGILYMGFSDGYLVALDAKTGTVKWEQWINKNKRFKDLDGAPLVDGDEIYITGFDSALYCLKKDSGNILWKSEPGGFGDVLINEDQIIYSTSTGQVIALNKKDGSKVWTFNIDDGVATSPILYQNRVVVAESQGRILFLNLKTGKLEAEFDPGRGSFSPLAVDEKKNELYFISREAHLYKLSTRMRDSHEGIPWLR